MSDFLLFFNLSVVATDDERIADCCRGFGADVIMTSESCRNGLYSFFLVYTDLIWNMVFWLKLCIIWVMRRH